MSVTVDSPFRAPARITKAKWLDVVKIAYTTPLFNGVPVDDRPDVAAGLYDFIARSGHDPAVWLAIAMCEHTLGTNPDSVLWRNDTRSWTNARTVRDPALTGWKIVRDAVRKSDYVKYQTVADSVQDGLYRVDEPGYAYRKAGAVSIIDHTMIWTEGDGPEYAARMVEHINRWMEDAPMAAQIPGFTWYEADADHYDRGRREPIRGGAQHYTAGTNSLNWLSKTSSPPVSVHFLVKHTPALDDRGWQLVRIEDTAWTTAFANPYTVAIEYEHMANQSIPDAAYDVLAQTWIDIAAYVKAHGLGTIPLTRAGIRGHKEWVNNPSLICPDGIDVGRIVTRIQELIAPDPTPADPDPLTPNPSVPDHHQDNPYGDFWIPTDISTRMIVDETQCGFLSVGYVVSGAFVEGDKLVVYTERRRYERHRDGRIYLGLVGLEAMKARQK